MTTEQIDQLIRENAEKLDPECDELVRVRLVGADDEAVQQLFAELKSPTTLLLVSVFLGMLGIDRFILGQKMLGVLKLITGGGCGIWTIIDWFTNGDRTRAYNTKKILSATFNDRQEEDDMPV